VITTLSDLVNIRGGGTPSRKVAEYWNGDIPWVSVKDFKSTRLSDAQELITQSGIDNSSTHLIPAGNIIIPTRMALGKVAINEVDIAINQDLKALLIRDTEILHPQYLLRFLESKSSFIERQGKGATVKGITLDVLKNLEIPLPPLPVQKQIAALLEKADTLRSQCRQMEQELNQLAQSVFLEMFGDNERFKKMTVGDSLQLINGRAFKSEEWKNAGLPIIRIQNLKNSNVSFNCFDGEYDEKHRIRKGDVLLSWAGQLVSFGVFIWDRGDGLLNQHIFKVIPKTEMSSLYLKFALSIIVEKAKLNFSGIDMKHITKRDLSKYELAIPDLNDQLYFEDTVSRITKNLESVKSKKMYFDDLFSSLMQRAFKGELELNQAA